MATGLIGKLKWVYEGISSAHSSKDKYIGWSGEELPTAVISWVLRSLPGTRPLPRWDTS